MLLLSSVTTLIMQALPDGVFAVRLERRYSHGAPVFAIGVRGAKTSFAWLVGNAGAPAAWGRPPLATRAVATFNAVLEEAAALEVPSTEICWGGLLEAVQSVYR
jgi:hypothetical protein